jgi:hypothetical protein
MNVDKAGNIYIFIHHYTNLILLGNFDFTFLKSD